MKKILFVLPLLFAFSCTLSVEKRCEILAKSEIKKLIGNADYEILETEVDSAYTSIYTNPDVVKAALDLVTLNIDSKRTLLKHEYNSAKTSVALWSDSDTAYGRENWRQAKEELNDCIAKMEELNAKEDAAIEKIRECAKNVVEGEYYGYNIYQRLRRNNQFLDILIISDENIENVRGRFVIDDRIDYSLTNLKKVIDKALNK